MLSTHSFNALLKTLEEPPPHVKFIFATTDPHKVLATILSRCQRYDLRRIGLGALTRRAAACRRARRASRCPSERWRWSRARPRAACATRSRCSSRCSRPASGTPDEATARALLGAADRALVVAVADAVLAGDAAACLRQLATLHEHGYDAQRFCRDLLEHVRHLAVLAATGDAHARRRAARGRADARCGAGRRGARRTSCSASSACSSRPTRRSPRRLRTIDPQLVLEMACSGWRRCRRCCRWTRSSRGSTRSPARRRQGRRRPRRRAGLAAAARADAGRRSAAAPPAPPATLWESVLARVRQERVSLYMTLAAARPLGVSDGVLRLGLDSEALRRELSGKDTLDAARRARQRDRRPRGPVEVGPVPGERAGETPHRAGPAARARRPWPTRWCRPRSRSSGPRCAGCATGGPVTEDGA